MCLAIDRLRNEFDPEMENYVPYVAKEDMVVWKIGTIVKYDKKKYFHPCYKNGFRYIPNKDTEFVKMYPEYMKSCDSYKIDYGYHAYVSKKHANEMTFMKVQCVEKFIIKKGTPYFLGDAGDIVASQIMWKDESKIKRFIERVKEYVKINVL